MTLTYASYLKLDELLELQQPISESPEHDEMLFIIIHQVYELWFKEVLHELDYLQHRFRDDDTPRVLHTLRRILTILKTMVGQIDILETMTPIEFHSFRNRLESASGFQSFQFRELEFALGHKRTEVFEFYPEGSKAWKRLKERFHQPSLWDAFLHYLAQNNYPLPQEILARDVTKPVKPSPEVQTILIDLYNKDPMRLQVCERLVDFDEGFQEWRYRHVKMVERTIGNKQGTGGSQGVQYLTTTLSKPAFPDLWAIRTQL